MLKSTEFLVVDGFCGLHGALEKMRQQLQESILEGNQREYATDVEDLCKEVDFIYLEKLKKVHGFYISLLVVFASGYLIKKKNKLLLQISQVPT